MDLGWRYWIWWPMWKRVRPAFWFFQRARRGWSDRDLWSFDQYLAEVFAGGFRRLADQSHGYPAEYADGFGPWEVASDQVKETFTYEDWQAELRHAADLFDEIAEGDYGLDAAWGENPSREKISETSMAAYERELAVRKEALDWFSRRFGNLWD